MSIGPGDAKQSGAAATLLLLALLACGGDDTRCSAQLDYKGARISGSGADSIEAQHNACRAWCNANDSKVKAATTGRAHEVASCASRCGGDLLFDQGSATVSCK